MANDTPLTPCEKNSIVATIVIGIGLAMLAWASFNNNWVFWLAASVGGLGGLVHEIAQSGGKIAYFRKYEDGMYLGTVAGVILGAVAGILVVRGFLTDAPNTVLAISKSQLAYEVFTAGLALKGVTEAAGGTTVSETTEKPGG